MLIFILTTFLYVLLLDKVDLAVTCQLLTAIKVLVQFGNERPYRFSLLAYFLYSLILLDIYVCGMNDSL